MVILMKRWLLVMVAGQFCSCILACSCLPILYCHPHLNGGEDNFNNVDECMQFMQLLLPSDNASLWFFWYTLLFPPNQHVCMVSMSL